MVFNTINNKFTVSAKDTGFAQTTNFNFLIYAQALTSYDSFFFDFGDKSTANVTQSEQTIDHVFNKVGTYNVKLYGVDSQTGKTLLPIDSIQIPINYFYTDKTEGFAKATPFRFKTNYNDLKQYNTYLWNFGDGEYSRSPQPTHVYKNAGNYKVTYTAYDSDGNYIQDTTDLKVKLYLNESIYFDYVPPPTFAGHLNRYPFKVNITSSSTESHYIDLASQFSKSYDYQVPENKWSFLRPQWRFLDLNGNIITKIKTNDTPVKIDEVGNISNNGKVVGVTGYAEFYFVDDLYNFDSYLNEQPYTTIIATLQTSGIAVPDKVYNTDDRTPSFANSKVVATVPYIINWRDPDYINLTENLNQQISKIKFTNQNVPYLLTLGYNASYPLDDWYDGIGTKIASSYEFAHFIPDNDFYNVPIQLNSYNYNGSPLNINFNSSSKFNYYDIKTNTYYNTSLTEILLSFGPLNSINTVNSFELSSLNAEYNLANINYYYDFNNGIYYRTQTGSYVLSSYKFNNLNLNLNRNPSIVYFNYDDENSFNTGGYYKGTFNCKISSLDCYIQSSVNFKLLDNKSKFFNPILWISNPNAGMISTANYFKKQNLNIETTKKYLTNSYVKNFDMPVLQNANNLNNPFGTNGYHGIYSIAVTPSPTYHAWLSDSELNKIYRVNTKGQILKTIDLVQLDKSLNYGLTKYVYDYLGKNKDYPVFSPAHIALDSNKNLWVTLHDTPHALKFDKFGNYTNIKTTFSQNNVIYDSIEGNKYMDRSLYPTTKFFTDSISTIKEYRSDTNNSLDEIPLDDLIIKPTGIDTDLNDNIWITYTSPFSGWLVKYNSLGVSLTSFPYPEYSCPQEIVCDNQNNIWVVCTKEVSDRNSYLEKRNSYGKLLSSIGFKNSINHITLDNNQNPWFTFGYNEIGTVDNKGKIVSFVANTNSYSDTPPSWFNPKINADITTLEGISCDLKNNIYAINSIENKILVINPISKQVDDSFVINPKGFVFSLSAENAPTEVSFDAWSKSAQAGGDWSGFRWFNKYSTLYYNNTSNYTKIGQNYFKSIKGNSKIDYQTGKTKYFSFYNGNYYDLFKVNENFDVSNYMKSFSFQPVLQNSTFLYDNFLNSIFNLGGFSKHDALGIQSYEKIANYVQNKSDIDTCDIDSLYDLAKSVNLDTDDFRLDYPIDIRKSMDVLSINESRLFGEINDDSYNFIDYNENLNFNNGNLLDVDTYVVNAGVKLILKIKTLGKYQIINTGKIDLTLRADPKTLINSNVGTSTYTLYDLAKSLNLGSNWQVNYEFYEFLPSQNKKITNNIIDWDNTNLNRTELLNYFKTGSGLKIPDYYLNWADDEGIMEFIFTYQLYKGFGLI
jgi:hypothetical protein